MSTTIVYRLITPVVFTRIEVPVKGKISDIKDSIAKKVGIEKQQLKIYFDQKYSKPLNLNEEQPISTLNLPEGSPIFISNTQIDKKIPVLNKNQPSRCNHGPNERCINCMEEKAKKDPPKKKNELEEINKKQGLTPKCTHQPGQKCLHCMKPPEKGELKYTCQHGPGGMCPNCVNKNYIEDAKHKSFDQYINEKKQKCKGTHEISTQCINCMPPALLSYKMKKNCPNHPPYPEGVCNKCMPPNIFLNRQIYRHVDYVEFMNPEELNDFIKPWVTGLYSTQRMAYLFGYYSSDPNYPDGIRAIVEALYEPKQIGDSRSVQPLQDSDIKYVDKITEALSLECVGWIFTSTTEKGVELNSYDVRKAARYQEEYPMTHKSGCKISRYVTCVVKANDMGECEIKTYMVSDMCQAMERDGLFDDSKDPKKMQIRKQKKNELLPTVYMVNSPATSFDPDFFIVNISHGSPNDKKGYNILKSYDFPVESRQKNGIVTQNMIKEYFKKHKGEDALNKYANFYFLLFLAKAVESEFACSICQQIAKGTIDVDLVQNVVDSYI